MSIADRSILACWGVQGRPGRAAVPGHHRPRAARTSARSTRSPTPSRCAAGEVIRIRTTGGGGWGDPLDRDPALVVRDVRVAQGVAPRRRSRRLRRGADRLARRRRPRRTTRTRPPPSAPAGRRADRGVLRPRPGLRAAVRGRGVRRGRPAWLTSCCVRQPSRTCPQSRASGTLRGTTRTTARCPTRSSHCARRRRCWRARRTLVPDSIVAERDGAVVGFAATGGDEVGELFVAQEARGTAARPGCCCARPSRPYGARGTALPASGSCPAMPALAASTSGRAGATRVMSTTRSTDRTARSRCPAGST